MSVTMADVQAVFGTLLALGIAFPGLLAAIKLILPGAVDAAAARLGEQPGRCFGRGLLRVALIGSAVFALLAAPAGPLKMLGVLLGFSALAWAAIGAAGLATVMATRLRADGASGIGPWTAFLAGAVTMELAAVFPAVGWFVVLPLLLLTCVGAAPKLLRSPRRMFSAFRAGLARTIGPVPPSLQETRWASAGAGAGAGASEVATGAAAARPTTSETHRPHALPTPPLPDQDGDR